MARREKKFKPKATKRPTPSKLDRYFLFVGVFLVLATAAAVLATHMPQPTGRGIYTGSPLKLQRDFASLARQVQGFEDLQSKADGSLVSDNALQTHLSKIQLLAAAGNYIGAESAIKSLALQIRLWKSQLAGSRPSELAATSGGDRYLPILIYHYPPDDFDAELTYLEQNNYTVVGMDAVAAAMNNDAPLPDKPVAITFDDGFANQMWAFKVLQRHRMKATFYIINGGRASNWCIGAGRHFGDPSQPAGGCGDAYLSWDQVRTLDRSGLITIGGHTLDHPELTTLSAEDQRHEIADSKTGIEAQIGHPIYDFAYPYGNYDDTTIQIVREAGYRTAVTTLPGAYQPPGSVYTLRRVRTPFDLP